MADVPLTSQIDKSCTANSPCCGSAQAIAENRSQNTLAASALVFIPSPSRVWLAVMNEPLRLLF
jgi:hypothetical protein